MQVGNVFTIWQYPIWQNENGLSQTIEHVLVHFGPLYMTWLCMKQNQVPPCNLSPKTLFYHILRTWWEFENHFENFDGNTIWRLMGRQWEYWKNTKSSPLPSPPKSKRKKPSPQCLLIGYMKFLFLKWFVTIFIFTHYN
jgi:hypothetical protein